MTVKDRIDVEVDSNEYTFTRLDGKLHSFDDAPSQFSADGSERLWHKNGKLHRDGGLPAFIREETIKYPGTDVVVYRRLIQEWYRNGLMSRDGDLPTEQGETFKFDRDTGLLTEETFYKKWYKGDGVFHRDGDKPAMVHRESKFNLAPEAYDIVWELIFYKNDEEHRDGDKPSYVYTHNIAGGGASFFAETLRYSKKDELHREGGKPAVLSVDFQNKTKVSYTEGYFENGVQHRVGEEPAYVDFNDSRKVVRYCQRGQLNRNGEPALVVESADKVISGFYQHGILSEGTVLHSGFSKFLLNELVKVLPVEFGSVEVGEFPSEQLASILCAVTGKTYTTEVTANYEK